MNKNQSLFADWLIGALNKKGWKQADLAKASKLTPTAISDVLSGKRNAGSKFCERVALAFNLPPETVYRAAGILPPLTPKTALIETIDHIISTLPQDDQEDILEYARLRQRLAEQKAQYNVKPNPKTGASETPPP